MKKEGVIFISLCFLMIISIFSVSALSLPIHLRPKTSAGKLQPNQNFNYTLKVSNSNSCEDGANILLSNNTIILTDESGTGFMDLDISSLTTTPSRICVYIGVKLEANLSYADIIFNSIRTNNIYSNNWTNLTGLTDTIYLNLSGGNANQDINIGIYNFTTTGTGRFDAGLFDNSNNVSISLVNRRLIDSSGMITFEWENRFLQDENGNTGIEFTTSRVLVDSGGFDSIKWNDRNLKASSNAIILDWENQILYSSDGSDIILNWSTVGLADFDDSNITTTGDIFLDNDVLITKDTAFELIIGIDNGATVGIGDIFIGGHDPDGDHYYNIDRLFLYGERIFLGDSVDANSVINVRGTLEADDIDGEDVDLTGASASMASNRNSFVGQDTTSAVSGGSRRTTNGLDYGGWFGSAFDGTTNQASTNYGLNAFALVTNYGNLTRVSLPSLSAGLYGCRISANSTIAWCTNIMLRGIISDGTATLWDGVSIVSPVISGSGGIDVYNAVHIYDVTGATINRGLFIDSDTLGTTYGAGADTLDWYNGSDKMENPKVVGSGKKYLLGEQVVTENATFQSDVIIDGILYGGSPVKIAGINITDNLFSHMENKNSSLSFALQNLNSGTNATTIITAKNDVGGSMNIGIGSSNFMIGDTSYMNITALFSKSRGETIFANFYNQPYVWLYNPSDDNDPNNLVEVMRLDDSGLNLSVGNITSENVFIPQYVFSHNNATISLVTQSVWANITFDQEEADLKFGISHTYNDATNTTFTIGDDGIYDIEFDFDAIDTSASSTDIDVAGRAIYENGTEIVGSVFETDITKKDIETEVTHEFLAELRTGDKIVFQFVADDADVQVSTHGTFGDHPESASIVIEKIANLQ